MKIRNTLLAGAAIAALALPGMAQAGDLAGTVSDATDTIALRSAQAAEAGLPNGSPDWLRAQDVGMQARALLEQQMDKR